MISKQANDLHSERLFDHCNPLCIFRAECYWAHLFGIIEKQRSVCKPIHQYPAIPPNATITQAIVSRADALLCPAPTKVKHRLDQLAQYIRSLSHARSTVSVYPVKHLPPLNVILDDQSQALNVPLCIH